ncbi:MAG: ABC transporter ATP-binding protein [Spirochaetales bacterium]|nr:ABC transporter ATP-binding protein [Spirochaetales bacterium]
MREHGLGTVFRPGRAPGGPVYTGMKEKPKYMRKTLGRLFQFIRGQRLALLGVFLFVIVSSLASLGGPYLIGKGVDTLVGGIGKVDFLRLRKIVLGLLLIYLLGSVATFLQSYLLAKISQQIVSKIRQTLFHHIQTLPVSFFDLHPYGDLLSRMTNDIENINMILSQGIVQVFSSIITLSGALLMMIFLSPLLTAFCLIVIPFGFVLTSLIANRTRIAFSEQQKELGMLDGFIEEIISGERVVKAFHREEKAREDFHIMNQRLRARGIQAQILSGAVPPLMNLMNNFSFLITAVAGGWFTLKGRLTLGIIASFLQYSRHFMRPINETANQVNLLQAALAGAERVFEILDVRPENADSNTKKIERSTSASSPTPEKVRFDHVHFSYTPGVAVLQDIDFTAVKGQMIAIVGPTGVGKTTLVNLLARFYEVEEGAILFDSKDIRTFERTAIRKALGIVLQDTYLFSDTVRENIRYGRLDATDKEVEEAARLVEADSFIRKLPQGYSTVLIDEGGNISQGERQLITIARALLADPSILVLDEATSNVDTRTELHIQRALKKIRKGRTSFVIAHRLSTIKDADCILFIQGGKIVERGTHTELLAHRGAYYALYHAQFRREAELRSSHNLVE